MFDNPSSGRQAIRSAGIRYIRFTWTDNAGLIRAKAVHTAFLEEIEATTRVGLTPAAQALPVMYDAPSPGLAFRDGRGAPRRRLEYIRTPAVRVGPRSCPG